MEILMKTTMPAVVVAVLIGRTVFAQNTDGNPVKPSAWRDKYTSQRIEALRKDVATGHVSTVAFWEDVSKQGTPLIEPSHEGDSHQLVTFVWRGTPNTHNVLVVSDPFTWVRPQDYLMKRVRNTDVWYLVLRLPRRARFAYRLSPNDPLDAPSLGHLNLGRGVQQDPLNPHRSGSQSVVELPGAPLQPWIGFNPAAPHGEILGHTIASAVLGNVRDIWVYSPTDYRPDVLYPLVVLFDGPAQLESMGLQQNLWVAFGSGS